MTRSRHQILTLCLFLCSSLSHAADGYRIDTVATGLNYPWGMTFLPDGSALVTELAGTLRALDTNGKLSEPIANVPEVFFAGQGGLFDVVLAPDYTTSRTIYLSYAAGDAKHNATTVARAQLGESSLSDVEVVFEANPKKYAPLHYGGRLAWLPDGDLLLTTGDGFDFREQAQLVTNHFGKTIRIPVSGRSPSPFNEAPLVWSYGHRNPQGLAVSRNGTVYQHEHGPRGGDEVNVIEPGNNYGWPAITYGMDYNGAYVSPFTEHPDMLQPIHKWVPSIAPSGLMVYEGQQFPDWNGDLFVGALVDRGVRRLDLENGRVLSEEAVFPEISARIRDIREAPDGAIWVITDGPDGELIRVSAATQ